MSIKVLPAKSLKDAILANSQDFLSFHPYRNHGVFSPDELLTILQHDVCELIENEDTVAYALLRNDLPMAVCGGALLPWDSRHFGRRMAKLECYCAPDTGMDDLHELIVATLSEMSHRLAPHHISCHVDADSYALFNALSQTGFLLQDAKRTYIVRSTKPPAGQKHRPFSPREYQADDREQVLGLFGARTFRSRFTRDPALDLQKAADLYPLWAQQLMELPPSERVLHVVERHGHVLAVGGVKNIDFLGYGLAKKGLGDGVFACLPRAAGSYVSVLMSLIESGISKGYDFLETKASLNNRPATRVLGHIGGDAVTCHYALHKTSP